MMALPRKLATGNRWLALRHVAWCKPIEGVRQHVVAKLVRIRQVPDRFFQARVFLRHDIFHYVPYPKTASSRSVDCRRR